jgi:tRNA pseudouridine55 synthase
MGLNGILLIDKPREWTSFDVVAKIRGVLQREAGQKIKVGHTGTLDPLATGLIIVTIGSYCKRADEFSKLDKTYEVTMKLGETSKTGDEEGEKTVQSSLEPSKEQIEATLRQFVGEIEQTPPAYSAVKIDGKRAYKLARAGKEVEIKPRQVRINDLVLRGYGYPYVKFLADVGSGTYIRSLVEDLGENLTTGAYTSELRRITVGKFELGGARAGVSQVEYEGIAKSLIVID